MSFAEPPDVQEQPVHIKQEIPQNLKELDKLKYERKMALKAVEQRNLEYSMDFNYGHELYFDTSTKLVLEQMDQEIQRLNFQIQNLNKKYIPKNEDIDSLKKRIMDADSFVQAQDQFIQKNSLENIVKTTQQINFVDIPQLSKTYTKLIKKNQKLRNRLSHMKERH